MNCNSPHDRHEEYNEKRDQAEPELVRCPVPVQTRVPVTCFTTAVPSGPRKVFDQDETFPYFHYSLSRLEIGHILLSFSLFSLGIHIVTVAAVNFARVMKPQNNSRKRL